MGKEKMIHSGGCGGELQENSKEPVKVGDETLYKVYFCRRCGKLVTVGVRE